MKKILIFVVNEDNKVLLLHNNFNDKTHGGNIWYTVTGGVEESDKNLYDTVKREVKEETNLTVIESIYTNVILKYNNKNTNCYEYVFVSFVNGDNVILNEESTEYLWLDVDDFLNQCYWYYDRKILENILVNGINKKIYYSKETELDF